METMIDPPLSLYIKEAGESIDSSLPPAVRNGLLKDFVPLPKPGIPLTDSQIDALFAPANRAKFCRALVNAVSLGGDHAA